MHRISDIRVGGVAKANFRIFQAICGERALKNVVIATTMWSKVTDDEGTQRVAELGDLDDFLKPALSKGAKMFHLKDDSLELARELVRGVVSNHPLPLAIQEELVIRGRSIDETSATKEVDVKLAAVKEEWQKKLGEQERALAQAMRDKDEETRQEQAEAAERSRKVLDRYAADRRDSAERYRALQKRLAAAERPEGWKDWCRRILGLS